MPDRKFKHLDTAKFESAFIEIVEQDTEAALQLITGMFVGLTVEYTRRSGEDASKTLHINGCGNRDITIHAIGE
jgi:hypothetical protein